MTERIWDKFLTERDKTVFSATGYGARQGFGKRPALLVIDVNYAFAGERPEPILDAIQKWRTCCGEDAWPAIAVIRKLLDAAHDKGIPVIYTTDQRREDNWDAGSWAWKSRRSGEDVAPAPQRPNIDSYAIVAEIAPGPRDILVRKHKPSGFFGTSMVQHLVQLGCDSLIVAGTTTSGCVRATVLDAFSTNYRVSVVEDACFDRSQASHAMSLCDMHAKYADVLPSDEILAFLAGYPAGQFQLPAGLTRR
jgi:nicotinamidase-related amidase